MDVIDLTAKKAERGIAHKIFKRLILQPDKKTVTGCEYSIFTVYNHLSGKLFDPNVEIERLAVEAELQQNGKAMKMLEEVKQMLGI